MSSEGADECVEVVKACDDLDESIRLHAETQGLRLDAIFPADQPQVALMSGPGIRLRLETAGSQLRLAADATDVLIPAPAADVVITEGGHWVTGRAGMLYRDLVPGRWGGAFIASHIRVPDGGPVPDYVHYHHVLFQAIYCVQGWVRLVYEDQGEPFLMRTGDCVLQPPGIRHRVLECSDGFEVVEIGAPALHATRVEHELELPNTLDRGKKYGDQLFIHHVARDATWSASHYPGVDARDCGLNGATNGLVTLRVLRLPVSKAPLALQDAERLQFRFVLSGRYRLVVPDQAPRTLDAHAAFTLPGGIMASLEAEVEGEILELATSF